MIYEYWEKENTPFSSDYDLWKKWLFQYNYKLWIGKAIEIDYFTRKPE